MKTPYKLILIAIIFFSGYATLRIVLNSEVTPLTFEIYAAIIGFTITSLTTWALLGKQTENELKKEDSIRFLNLKTSIYLELIKQLEDIIRNQKITHEDVIELRLLNQKMIFAASEEVLVAFNKFVLRFVKLAEQKTISDKNIDDLLDEMSLLSVAVRKDLMGDRAKDDPVDKDLRKLILRTNELMDFESGE